MVLPLTELTSLFQTAFGLCYVNAFDLSESVRNTSVVCLPLSIFLRYYGAVKPHKGARLLSFLCVVVALDFFLLGFLPRLTFGFSIEIRAIAFPLSFFALFVIYFLIGILEKRVISFYAKRGIVSKKYAEPIVSFLFAMFSACFYVASVIQLVLPVFFNVILDEAQSSILFGLSYVFFVDVGCLLFLLRTKIIKLRLPLSKSKTKKNS